MHAFLTRWSCVYRELQWRASTLYTFGCTAITGTRHHVPDAGTTHDATASKAGTMHDATASKAGTASCRNASGGDTRAGVRCIGASIGLLFEHVPAVGCYLNTCSCTELEVPWLGCSATRSARHNSGPAVSCCLVPAAWLRMAANRMLRDKGTCGFAHARKDRVTCDIHPSPSPPYACTLSSTLSSVQCHCVTKVLLFSSFLLSMVMDLLIGWLLCSYVTAPSGKKHNALFHVVHSGTVHCTRSAIHTLFHVAYCALYVQCSAVQCNACSCPPTLLKFYNQGSLNCAHRPGA